jgi:hypothetical protein
MEEKIDAPLPMFTDDEGEAAGEWVVLDYERRRLCDGQGRGGISFTLVDAEVGASTAQTVEDDEPGGTTPAPTPSPATTIAPAPTPSPAVAPASVLARTLPTTPDLVTIPLARMTTEMHRLGCALEHELYMVYSVALMPGVRPSIKEPSLDTVVSFSSADRATIYNLSGWALNAAAKKLSQIPETADWCSSLVSYCSIPLKDAKAAGLPIEKARVPS